MTGNNKLFFEYIIKRLNKYDIKPTMCKDRSSWKMEIRRREDFDRLVEYMFKDANIYLDRKYEKLKEIKKIAVLDRNI